MPRGCIGRATVQIHVTRSCNLRCLHCYSESGPRITEALPPDAVRTFLDDARAQGYEVAAFSGGEPFLYPELASVLRHARALGFVTTGVTNGTVRGARFERTAPLFDALAVSVDGRPLEHDRLRDSPRAFEATCRGLATLRGLGVPFGLAHTARKETIASFRWLTELARDEGARLLQLHPLGAAGNAAGTLDDQVPSLADCARIHLLAAILREELGETLQIQVDLMNRELALSRPELVLADDARPTVARPPLARLVNPLVLTSSGDVLPLTHGMSAALRLGNVHQARLRAMVPSFLATRHDALRGLCRGVLDQIARLPLPYFDWYEMVAAASHRATLTL